MQARILSPAIQFVKHLASRFLNLLCVCEPFSVGRAYRREIAVGMISLKTMAEVQAKAIELNAKILSAQHELFAANAAQSQFIERIRELEEQIANKEAWNAQKQRYRLATPYSGVTAFALQKAMSNGEPPHYVCANCFQGGKLAIPEG